MDAIKETYIQIDLGDRVLGRRRYSFSEIRRARPKCDGSLTSSLLLKMRDRELREPGKDLMPSMDKAYKEYTSSLSLTSDSYAAFDQRSRAGSEVEASAEPAASTEEKGHRLRRLKARISDTVFDYSELEQEKIEQEINSLVNADGYYDEVEPIDIDVDYKEERHINKAAVIAAVILIIYAILILRF